MSIYRRVATIFLGIVGISPIVWTLVVTGSQTPIWKVGATSPSCSLPLPPQ